MFKLAAGPATYSRKQFDSDDSDSGVTSWLNSGISEHRATDGALLYVPAAESASAASKAPDTMVSFQPVGELASAPGDLGASLPVYTLNEIGDYVKQGFWDSVGGSYRSYNMTAAGTGANNGTLYYDYDGFTGIAGAGTDPDGLSTARRALVDDALDYIGEVLGIDFVHNSAPAGGVDLYFKDNSGGAFSNSALYAGGNGTAGHNYIDYSWVNVDSAWSGGTSDINDYTYQTFIHEIGHAIGLGHAGRYNGVINWVTDTTDPNYLNNSNMYLNDSWQQSIMWYAHQDLNTYIPAATDFNYVITYMAGDWEALRDYYGSGAAFNGNTVYGFNTNIATGVSETLANLATWADETAFCIIDSDGVDTLDFSGYATTQLINLTIASSTSKTGSISNIGGQIGNMTLGVGTVIENAVGGSGADTILGNTAENVLTGNAGNDVLEGNLNSDTLSGGTGNDTLYAMTAANIDGSEDGDILNGNAGDDSIFGSAGNDTINGGADNDTVHARGGDDTINAGDGNDTIYAGPGNDAVKAGSGNDTMTDTEGMGASNDDIYNGGEGTDTLIHDRNWASTVAFNLNTGFATSGGSNRDQLISIENLTVGGAASVTGSIGANVLTVNGTGNNSINGLGGDDTINAGGGDDTINAGGGKDTINAGPGNDTVKAGSGNDTMTDTEGMGASNADVYNGGSGTDTLIHDRNWASTVAFNLNTGFATSDGNNRDQLISIENLTVGGAASVTGSNGANVLTINGTGNNSINGLGGNDIINAGDGNDTLRGGAGADHLYGGTGADVLNGGADFDYACYDTAAAGVTADLSGVVAGLGEAAGDTFVGIEGILASIFGDTVYGDGGANTLFGRNGDDTLNGRTGMDLLAGEAGNDTFVFRVGEATGDRVSDFNGNAALTGDEFIFDGYGAGATFVQLTATNWSINYSGGSEVIQLLNAASVDASDYAFV